MKHQEGRLRRKRVPREMAWMQSWHAGGDGGASLGWVVPILSIPSAVIPLGNEGILKLIQLQPPALGRDTFH